MRAAVAKPVRCRGALSAAWAVWQGVCRKSVGTVADASALAGPAGRLSTKRSDVSAGHGRVDTRRHHLDEIRVSYGSEGWGFESLRARLQNRPVTWEDILIPTRSVRSMACRTACISYRNCHRRPAERASRGGPADLVRPGRVVRSMLCASVHLAARRRGPRRPNSQFSRSEGGCVAASTWPRGWWD